MIAAVYPEEYSEAIADGLALATAEPAPVSDFSADDRTIKEADVLVVDLEHQPMRRLREVARIAELVGIPVLLVVTSDQLALIEGAEGATDFLLAPIRPAEMRLRLHRLVDITAGDEMLRFKDLELNPLNFQATVAEAPLDLTYMEYELLRYLVANPGRVWSREQLLSRVWGYEYYGGARTVDVHIRRLRSKLGEERSSWITTVRSVGYRFG